MDINKVMTFCRASQNKSKDIVYVLLVICTYFKIKTQNNIKFCYKIIFSLHNRANLEIK